MVLASSIRVSPMWATSRVEVELGDQYGASEGGLQSTNVNSEIQDLTCVLTM